VAQRAPHLIVQNRTPRVVTRFIAWRLHDRVARMRERDRAAAEGLNDEQNRE